MTGTSREHAAALRQRLDARRGDAALPGLAGELFAAADAIGGELQLRAALSDAGQPAEARVATVQALFGPRLSALAVQTLADVVALRWPDPTALVEAIEGLAAQAAFLVAEQEGHLDAVEDELFVFSRAVSGSADLQMALTDPSVGPKAKEALVASLLQDRATAWTTQVVGHAMATLRGRRADTVLEDLMALAAEQRGRAVAEVRVAHPLQPDQAERLAAVLSRLHGRAIRLNVALDPAVVGGVAVRIGTEVIDGTLANRIEQARRALVG
jgi:F-type H+-transporting ATPase subunit delta